MPHKRPGFDTSVWADIQPEILGIVLRFLPCLADRASVRSVCRHWRAGACSHDLLPPLPLLVLPKLRFSCLNSDGSLTPARKAAMPTEVADDNVRCVGSSDDWLVCVRPSKHFKHADGRCFLVNAFSQEVVHLPSVSRRKYSVYSSMTTLPIQNMCGVIHCTTNDWRYSMSLRNVVLSASPGSGSKYIVAAFCFCSSSSIPVLALWQPGMTAWYLCRGGCIDWDCHLVFYQGKLFMIWSGGLSIFALELGEDKHGVNVSRVERCLTKPLLPGSSKNAGALRFNLVVWRGKLLWILEYFNGYNVRRNLCKVRVFSLDCSTHPYGLTEIHNFDGDCIFVHTRCWKSFPARLHDGVEGDMIYFVKEYGINDLHDASDPHYDTFVYNMRDGTTRPFADSLSPGNFGAPENKLSFPVWCFPSNRSSAN
ncbi:hypothetical protein PR202_ga21993 [Eleusine coracana subsp. coracana]|uniref:KIB1-4 beta-propeller domain-containing protein n=1 Tax=Eleusine coracana subsp. coracana TaxID=191504 RepID=A0AAV5D281_ELECO|nr:hypothetical protein QOZ80_9AG0683380 [Eleusine coracana subsp. coracana]GJN04443.1 hypothetical protein PR202_ga21993 [Eleusine coracana subsp. coracana]